MEHNAFGATYRACIKCIHYVWHWDVWLWNAACLFLETGHRLEICLMNILREAFRTVSDGSTLRVDGLLFCKTNILVTQTTEGSWFVSWQDLEVFPFSKPP